MTTRKERPDKRRRGGRPSLEDVFRKIVGEALRDTSRYGEGRQTDAHVAKGMFRPLPTQRSR